MTACAVQGCERPARGQYCDGHWSQVRRGQDLRPLRTREFSLEDATNRVVWVAAALADCPLEDTAGREALLRDLERSMASRRAALVREGRLTKADLVSDG